MSKGLEALERNKYEIENSNDYLIIEKELKVLEIIKEIVKENVSDLGNVDFNINDYSLLKEVLL